MVVGRSSHAVFDTQYRLVWAPKYRKWILRGDALEAVRELFYRVVEDFDFVIEELEVAKNYVHIPLSFPPRYSISQVVGLLKSISASRVFQEHPEVKRELWGGEFLGGRVLCPHGRGSGYGRNDQAVCPVSLPRRETPTTVGFVWVSVRFRNRRGEAMHRA